MTTVHRAGIDTAGPESAISGGGEVAALVKGNNEIIGGAADTG